ncbi:uncharacterized protein CBL_07576 [Carabus blaptoides fortunei]
MSKPMLSLKQFMVRQQVITLYRRMLRSIRQIPDEGYRKEMQQWVRSDFRSNAHHTDEITIKMLITQGERSLKELENTIILAK